MSLLIAFAAPAILSVVMWVIGTPILLGISGISALVEKIKGHRRRPCYSGKVREEFLEQSGKTEESETPSFVEVQGFLLYLMDKGVHTKTELNREGKTIMRYSEAIMDRALNSLLEARLVKKIGGDVYYKVGGVVQETDIVGETAETQTAEIHQMTSILLEFEKQRKKQSNTFGIWSLVLGVIGIFTFFVPVAAVAAIVLGALQFRRHVSKCSISGLILGIIGVALFVIVIEWLSYEVPYTPTV